VRIPWRAKSAAYAALARVGDRPLWFAQKFVTRRSRVHAAAIKQSWRFHHDQLFALRAERIIEFGAGKSLIQNLFLTQLGLEQTVIDLKPMVDLEQVNAAIDVLEQLGVDLKGHANSLDDLESNYGIRYLAPSDMRRTDFSANSFDAVISTNTLEHIPKTSIEEILRESRRLLRPGGIFCAKIDYSDHYSHTDPHISGLNYLKFTESQWARHNHENHYQNRLRHCHHLELLTDAGFEIVEDSVADERSRKGLKLRPELLTGDPTDFFLDGFVVAANPALETG
jgi:SAM-dependent methyltransferase